MQRVVLAESTKNPLREDLFDPVKEAVAEDNINCIIRNILADLNIHIAILKSAGDTISNKTHVFKHVFDFILIHKISWHNQTVIYFLLPSSP